MSSGKPNDLLISRCYPWDLGRLEMLVKETWISAYTSVMGPDGARISAARFTKLYLLWLIASGLFSSEETLKATIGGRMVGMAYAVPDDDEIILYMLYVHPAHQGQGIGSRLLTAIEASKPKAKGIRLETLKDNARAIQWYERRGFEIFGATDNATGTLGVKAVYMDKRLQQPVGMAKELG
jgi:ribosomal protein S18 acetylase RimI-like enzyme